MQTKTVVWHEPTDTHAIFDHPSQITDFITAILGLPPETSIQVIPKEFHVFPDVPYHGVNT